jgi:hypothetical protein
MNLGSILILPKRVDCKRDKRACESPRSDKSACSAPVSGTSQSFSRIRMSHETRHDYNVSGIRSPPRLHRQNSLPGRNLQVFQPRGSPPHPLDADPIERLAIPRHDSLGRVIHEYRNAA